MSTPTFKLTMYNQTCKLSSLRGGAKRRRGNPELIEDGSPRHPSSLRYDGLLVMTINLALIFVLGICFNFPAFADPIKFEQGGASDSPGIVPAKKLQIESLLAAYTSLNKDQDYDVTLGETLLRYGLITDRLEIRTRIFGLTLRDGQVGMEKLSLGTKIGILKEKGLAPNADLIVDFAIPIDNDVYPNNFAHFYNLVMDHQLGDKVTAVSNLALSFIGTRQAGDDFTRVQVPYVFGLSYELTGKISISEEIFGTWSMSGKEGNSLGLASLLAYMFNDNFAGTATVLLGLNDNTDPVTVNLGLVKRF